MTLPFLQILYISLIIDEYPQSIELLILDKQIIFKLLKPLKNGMVQIKYLS